MELFKLNKLQLSSGEGWNPAKKGFNIDLFLCMFQAKTWIPNVTCRALFMFNELRWDVIDRFV